MDVGRRTIEDVPAIEGADEKAGGYHLRVLTPEEIHFDRVFP